MVRACKNQNKEESKKKKTRVSKEGDGGRRPRVFSAARRDELPLGRRMEERGESSRAFPFQYRDERGRWWCVMEGEARVRFIKVEDGR
jgi:hypothetical protein